MVVGIEGISRRWGWCGSADRRTELGEWRMRIRNESERREREEDNRMNPNGWLVAHEAGGCDGLRVETLF